MQQRKTREETENGCFYICLGRLSSQHFTHETTMALKKHSCATFLAFDTGMSQLSQFAHCQAKPTTSAYSVFHYQMNYLDSIMYLANMYIPEPLENCFDDLLLARPRINNNRQGSYPLHNVSLHPENVSYSALRSNG